MMRIKQMPKVETTVMPSGGFWGGVGEPTICVAAPAVLNAIAMAHRQALPDLSAARPRPDVGVNNRGGGAIRRSPYTVGMPRKSNDVGLSRRRVFAALAGASLAATVRIEPAGATPASMKAAINKVVGEAVVNKGRVRIDVPGAGRQRQHGAARSRRRQPDDGGRPRQEHSHLQRNESATERRQCLFRPALGPRPGFRPGSASPTPRPWSPSRRCPTARSGRHPPTWW